MQGALRGELVELIAAHLDGWGTGIQFERLEHLLTSSSEARQYYIDHLDMHARLVWERNNSVRSLPGESRWAEAIAIKEIADSPLTPYADNRRRRFNRASQWIGLAASLLLVGYFASLAGLLLWDRFHRGSKRAQIALTPPMQLSAQLLAADDATWTTERILQVRSGLAELTFLHGAKVCLQGPAEFEVSSADAGYLRRGSLVAVVPHQASGFMIQTPSATVIDLGTEFGVEVDSKGQTDVQVLQGEVELRPNSTATNRTTPVKSIKLTAGMALRVEHASDSDGGHTTTREIAATSQRFAWGNSMRGSRRIFPEGIVASSEQDPCLVQHLIDGSGMRGDLHSDDHAHMWMSATGKWQHEYVLFDFHLVHRLESMKVWNFNYPDGLNRSRGVKRANIYVSSSGKWDPLKQPDEWRLVAQDFEFQAAPGTPEYTTPDVISLGNNEARFVAIVIEEKFGPDPREQECVGLSEVQFFGERILTPPRASK